MYVKQFSVLIENIPGSLSKLMELLSAHHIDLLSVSLADTTRFGILRGITLDHDKTVQLLTDSGYTVRTNSVLAVSLPNRPGSLSEALKLLSDGGINVEYLYSCVHSAKGRAWIVLRVDDNDKAAGILTAADIMLLSEEDIAK